MDSYVDSGDIVHPGVVLDASHDWLAIGYLSGIIVMNYDWSGARTRRIAYFKRTTLLVMSVGIAGSFGVWLHFLH